MEQDQIGSVESVEDLKGKHDGVTPTQAVRILPAGHDRSVEALSGSLLFPTPIDGYRTLFD